jgi:hypothetical protein
MRSLHSRMATLLLIAQIGAACGDGGSGPDQDQVLTTLEVSPATTALYTRAPGNTVALTVVAKDQRGVEMTGVGSPAFSSDNSAVANVNDQGTITATGVGSAQVTASLTAGGVTATGTATVWGDHRARAAPGGRTGAASRLARRRVANRAPGHRHRSARPPAGGP